MKRSIEPSPLAPALRDELARSRRAGHDYDVLGKLPQLQAALQAAEVSGEDPPLEETLAPGGRFDLTTSRLASSAWKVSVIAVVLGGAMFAAWPARKPSVAPAVPARSQQRAEPVVLPPPAVPAPVVQVPAPAAPANADAPASSPALAPSSRREIAQLVRIRALLQSDPAAAYRLAQRGEREFPRGVLSEERQALRVLALAKSGEMDAARSKAREFFDRYPQSPMRELVEAAVR